MLAYNNHHVNYSWVFKKKEDLYKYIKFLVKTLKTVYAKTCLCVISVTSEWIQLLPSSYTLVYFSFTTYCQFYKDLNKLNTYFGSFIYSSKKQLFNDSVTGIIVDMEDTVVSTTDLILTEGAEAMEQPFEEKLVTKHDENYKT